MGSLETDIPLTVEETHAAQIEHVNSVLTHTHNGASNQTPKPEGQWFYATVLPAKWQ